VKISEIFYSIQGEGSLVGVPSVFVRTSGCNLRCVWCDTPYTSWRPEGEEMAVGEIMKAVAAYAPARHVVITGGEPMIAPRIVELTQACRDAGLHITIEPAGTVFQPVVCDLMSISPKLANSTPHEREGGRWAAQHERLRIQPEVLGKLTQHFNFQLKFVFQSEADLTEIKSLVAQLAVPPERVTLMPEGTSAGVLRDRTLTLVDVCKQTGYRMSPRLHVDIWGDRRGV
jgi:7-carboxy-7-deazaguanine synthase